MRCLSVSNTYGLPSLSLSLCNPFTPFSCSLNRPGKMVNTGIPDVEWQRHREELWDFCGCKEKRKKWLLLHAWVHSERPFRSHTYIFMSSYPPGPIVEKEAVSITGRPLWPLWKSCVCPPYLRVCTSSVHSGYSLAYFWNKHHLFPTECTSEVYKEKTQVQKLCMWNNQNRVPSLIVRSWSL